jgi:outer membrane lipoprotein carrier protein
MNLRNGLSALLCVGLYLANPAVPARADDLSNVIHALETPFQSNTAKEFRINDYSADFSQESKIASLDRRQHAAGRVEVLFHYMGAELAPMVKFRWQYEQPTSQEIVSDGTTLWVYVPENNQVIQSEVGLIDQAHQNDPMTFLTGLGNLSRDFRIGWATPKLDKDGNYALELIPQRISPLISRLVIVVDRLAVQAYLNHAAAAEGAQKPGQGSAAGRDPGQDQNSAPAFQPAKNDIRFPILATTIYDPNGNSTLIEFSHLKINQGIPDQIFNFVLPEGIQVVRPTGQEMGF